MVADLTIQRHIHSSAMLGKVSQSSLKGVHDRTLLCPDKLLHKDDEANAVMRQQGRWPGRKFTKGKAKVIILHVLSA